MHLAAGRYAEACERFDESRREEAASGTLLALAYCQELSGHLASAWGNYRAAAELAQREGHEERRGAATEQSKALASRLSVLTIVVPPSVAAAPGLRVTLDGKEIDRTSFGSPIPMDGGTYELAASAGKENWSATVSVQGERDKQVVVVELRVPLRDQAPPRAVVPTHRVEVVSASGPVERESKPSSVVPRIVLGTLAASAVGVGVGVGFGLSASSKNRASYRDGHCDARGCDDRGMDLRNGALRAARVSNWSFVAGGVLAVAGGALYAGHAFGQRSALRVQASVGQGGAEVGVGGAF